MHGYHISRPMPHEALQQWLDAQQGIAHAE